MAEDETDADEILGKLRRDIEQRVREQLARHLAIAPHADLARIVDIQIEQEKERLNKMADKFEEQDNLNLVEFTELLIDGWLPQLAKQIKQR
jgi:hypothetical protein